MVNSAPETWHFKTRRLSPFSRHVIALFSILLFDECWKRNPPPPHQLSVENYSALCKSVKRGRRRETATTRTRELWYLSTGPRRDIRNPLLAWRTVFIYLYIFFFGFFFVVGVLFVAPPLQWRDSNERSKPGRAVEEQLEREEEEEEEEEEEVERRRRRSECK